MNYSSHYSSHHQALLTKREELTKTLASREEIQIEGKLPDHLDEAIANSARSLAIDAVNRNHKLLKEVQHAMNRLGNLSELPYGLCESCEEEIAENRLNSVPWARFCIDCQVELEQRWRPRAASIRLPENSRPRWKRKRRRGVSAPKRKELS